MAHEIALLTKTEDGDLVEKEDQKWCFLHCPDGAVRTLCTGEVFGDGEGTAEAVVKTVLRGGITCKKCLSIIKEFKAIKL